jgi:hypothetical protein
MTFRTVLEIGVSAGKVLWVRGKVSLTLRVEVTMCLPEPRANRNFPDGYREGGKNFRQQ